MQTNIKEFFQAVTQSQHLTVQQLLLEDPSLVDIRGEGDTTPLMQAVIRKDPELVKILLKENSNIDAKDKDGSTALHRAVALEAESIIQMLLDKGANPNSEDENKDTPLSILLKKLPETEFAKPNIVQIGVLLLKAGANPQLITPTLLTKKSYKYILLLLIYLLKAGASFNENCETETRCLIHSINFMRPREPSYLFYLMEYGFDAYKECPSEDKKGSCIEIGARAGFLAYVILPLINAYLNKRALVEKEIKNIKTIKNARKYDFTKELETYLKAELIKRKIFKPLFLLLYNQNDTTPQFSDFTPEHQLAMTFLWDLSIKDCKALQDLLGQLYFYNHCKLLDEDVRHQISAVGLTELPVWDLDNIYLKSETSLQGMSAKQLHRVILDAFQNASSLEYTPAFKEAYPDFWNQPEEERNLIRYIDNEMIPNIEKEAQKETPQLLARFSL